MSVEDQLAIQQAIAEYSYTFDSAQESSARVLTTGVYHDQWRKTPQGWRLVHHALRA